VTYRVASLDGVALLDFLLDNSNTSAGRITSTPGQIYARVTDRFHY